MRVTRRAILATLTGAAAAASAAVRNAIAAVDELRRPFVDAACAMKRKAERAGDQPYRAVVVRDGTIVGWGPSRVVIDKDWDAHAERVALRDAQARLGRSDLSDCAIYSTSRPCATCQQALAAAGVARMFYGPGAADAGPPRGN
jgi:tRNA(adenine34) deaminase